MSPPNRSIDDADGDRTDDDRSPTAWTIIGSGAAGHGLGLDGVLWCGVDYCRGRTMIRTTYYRLYKYTIYCCSLLESSKSAFSLINSASAAGVEIQMKGIGNIRQVVMQLLRSCHSLSLIAVYHLFLPS